jgi:hypothetical protein
MRGAVLIIGSLLWDDAHPRPAWRHSRLVVAEAEHVKVPIRYGRRSMSRGNTFTMTFAMGDPLGQAVLVPLRTTLADPAALLVEAEALWQAEKPGANHDSISASWGCIGVLFRNNPSDEWARAWSGHFQRNTQSPIPPVGHDGLLRIAWPPVLVVEERLADVQLLLSTATEPDATPPLPEEVADAWVEQDQGHDRYFFENVRHGIRTPEDLVIWRRIEARMPSWLAGVRYAEAIAVLRDEGRRGG